MQSSVSKVKAIFPLPWPTLCLPSSISFHPSLHESPALRPQEDHPPPLPPDIPQPHAEPWAFSLELEIQRAAGSGHLLALGTPENPSWLSLRLQNQVRGDIACIQWHQEAVGKWGLKNVNIRKA